MTSNRAPVCLAPTVTFDRRLKIIIMDVKNGDAERGPQWQGRELDVLLEGMEGRYQEIHGKFSSSLSKTDKDKLWAEIVEE